MSEESFTALLSLIEEHPGVIRLIIAHNEDATEWAAGIEPAGHEPHICTGATAREALAKLAEEIA